MYWRCGQIYNSLSCNSKMTCRDIFQCMRLNIFIVISMYYVDTLFQFVTLFSSLLSQVSTSTSHDDEWLGRSSIASSDGGNTFHIWIPIPPQTPPTPHPFINNSQQRGDCYTVRYLYSTVRDCLTALRSLLISSCCCCMAEAFSIQARIERNGFGFGSQFGFWIAWPFWLPEMKRNPTLLVCLPVLCGISGHWNSSGYILYIVQWVHTAQRWGQYTQSQKMDAALSPLTFLWGLGEVGKALPECMTRGKHIAFAERWKEGFIGNKTSERNANSSAKHWLRFRYFWIWSFIQLRQQWQ